MRIRELFKTKYYIKNVYFLDSYLTFTNSIYLHFEEKDCFVFDLLDKSLFSKSENGIKLEVEKLDGNYDKYIININCKNQLIIKYTTYASLRYACRLINEMVNVVDGQLTLPIILIEDDSSFLYRGIIEGYYGKPWTYDNRIDLVDFMDKYRLNTYMYAPKCDRYHRDMWYKLYPIDEINKFKTLNEIMASRGIDFYYCISPGHAPEGKEGFVYVGDKDFKRLYKKLDQLIEIGIHSFGLLLDDIDYKLKGKNLEIFKRPGLAHAHICNQVYDYLSSKVNNLKFVMCPTEYHEIGPSQYRTDLKENLREDIYVFWTGDNVCAEVITDEQTKLTTEAFGNKLLIWENFPVSDFKYGVRQYVGPITNRSVNLNKYCDGYLINPMIYYELSKISMITEAHYAWNTQKYNSDYSYDLAIESYGEEYKNDLKCYFEFNLPSVLTYGNLPYERKIVDEEDKEAIIEYYKKPVKSAKKLLKADLPFITELKPWLKRTIKESEIVSLILENKITQEDLRKYYKDIEYSGCELLDYLIKKYKLLCDEDYEKYITKRRGNPWYRVWEYKR